jgi:hypothetical protein
MTVSEKFPGLLGLTEKTIPKIRICLNLQACDLIKID